MISIWDLIRFVAFEIGFFTVIWIAIRMSLENILNSDEMIDKIVERLGKTMRRR